MEFALLVAFFAVMLAVYSFRRRIAGLHLEPWMLVLGGVALIVMAWSWSTAETRGAAWLITACAVIPLGRGMLLFYRRLQTGSSTGE